MANKPSRKKKNVQFKCMQIIIEPAFKCIDFLYCIFLRKLAKGIQNSLWYFNFYIEQFLYFSSLFLKLSARIFLE